MVEWTFTNPSTVQQSGLLFRVNYPFGDAFWPIYEDNSQAFGTSFTTVITPLQNNGATNNTMPLVIYKNPDGSMFVAFCFTLAPGQTWSQIEGGFSTQETPDMGNTPVFITAQKSDVQTFSITYDSGQCQGYNQQSGSNLPCPANPVKITSAVMTLSQQVKPLFNDVITPSGASSTSNPTCMEMIVQGVVSMNGTMLVKGLECAFGSVPQQYRDSIKKRV